MTDKITNIVNEKIEKIAYGYVFSASDFPFDVSKQKSVNKVLENLTKADKIRWLWRYYKTKTTEFGELLSNQKEQIKSRIGYCEDKINEIVYELYGLTEEEIGIIEK
jgi:type II restriction/modification system DNA methylase subunit YeeA